MCLNMFCRRHGLIDWADGTANGTCQFGCVRVSRALACSFIAIRMQQQGRECVAVWSPGMSEYVLCSYELNDKRTCGFGLQVALFSPTLSLQTRPLSLCLTRFLAAFRPGGARSGSQQRMFSPRAADAGRQCSSFERRKHPYVYSTQY